MDNTIHNTVYNNDSHSAYIGSNKQDDDDDADGDDDEEEDDDDDDAGNKHVPKGFWEMVS